MSCHFNSGRVPNRTSLILLTVAGALAAAGGAQAQNAGAQSATQPQASATELQQVVVTATRRSENIQSVPISVTAFTKAQMDVQGIRKIDDIARLSPSIQFSRGGGIANTLDNSISIRGMGATAGPPTTGIYIDDTPIQAGAITTTGSFSDTAFPELFDIQRVEVLNGPQGTLFGSGSEGGAVRFITTPPNMETPSVYARTEVSDTQNGAPSYEIGIAGGAPIIADKLGFRASVWTRRDGGYIDHVDWYTGQVENPNNNYRQSESARFALGWKPTENLTITPSIFYQHIYANGSNQFWLQGDGITGSMFPGAPPLPVVQQPYGNVSKGDYVDLLQLNEWGNQRMTLPALKIEWMLPHEMELFSNTSYYERIEGSLEDFAPLESGIWGGSLFPPNPSWVNPGPQPQTNRFFTQEVRLQSTNNQARFKWVAGAFYSHHVSTARQSVYDPHLADLLAAGPYGCGTPAECYKSIFGTAPLVFGEYSSVWFPKQTDKQKALFGQADFRIVGGLIATVGVRYAKFNTDWIEPEAGPIKGVIFPGPGGVPLTGSTSASVVNPKYMLSYKTDHNLTYVSATKGFRNGGVNPPINLKACQSDLAKLGLKHSPTSYNPDSVWSYELGSKFTLLDGKLILDGAIYQYNWSNMINPEFLSTCTQRFTTNIGKAQGRGFELTAAYRPINPLTLSLNAGYNYLKATETLKSTGGVVETENGDTLTGGTKINAAVQYSFVVANLPTYFHVDYSYQGPEPLPSQETNPNDSGYEKDPLLVFPDVGYSVVDARLGINLGNWDISLFSDNLLNRQPLLGRNRDTITFFSVPTSVVEATTIRPRTSGITAIYRY